MVNEIILGAIAGDIIGSPYEMCNIKTNLFSLFTNWSNFTDDTVMTLAVAKWLTEDRTHSVEYLIRCMQELGRQYPDAGYGENFKKWLFQENPKPYQSWGNGSAMRVSPVGLYAKTIDEALALATISASVSHNHPEGIKGAQAIATSVYLCKEGKSKQVIKEYVEKTFNYNLGKTITEIRNDYHFDVSCPGSVPEAIIAFLEGDSFEEVIRLAISIGGDSDTIACMAGAIAACKYSIPLRIRDTCYEILPERLKIITHDFTRMIHKRERAGRLFARFLPNINQERL